MKKHKQTGSLCCYGATNDGFIATQDYDLTKPIGEIQMSKPSKNEYV